MGVETKEQLINHPLKGALFETLVVGELLKSRYNAVKGSNLYFFRDNSGHEVDCLLDHGTYCVPVEIKSSQTISESFFTSLQFYNSLQHNMARPVLVYGGIESYGREVAEVVSYRDLHEINQ